MKKIEAIIRPEKLIAVKDALSEAGIKGLTVSQVTGRGQQRTIVHSGRAGRGVASDMLQRVKIEIFVRSEDTDTAVNAIMESARTGQVGDGKIFVLPTERSVRIRTAEENEQAI